ACLSFRRGAARGGVGRVELGPAKLVGCYRLPSGGLGAGDCHLSLVADGRKILVVSELALLIDLTLGSADTLARDVITAQWAPGSDGSYYAVDESADTTAMHRRLSELYHRRLDAPAPAKRLGRDSLAPQCLES